MDYIMKNTPCGVYKSSWLRKSLNIMRCTFFFLLLGTLQMVASVTYSQSVRLSLDMENTTVREVLSSIEQKSDFYFTYNVKHINVNRKVSINIQDKSVTDILDELFTRENIQYIINDKHIVLYRADKESPIPQQKQKITGIVKDENGEPVIGANVMVKGSTTGNITDLDGRFSVEAAPDAVLQVSFIGYVSQDIKLNGKSSVTITLMEDTQALDEVIVVGYGSVKKQNLTSSVSKITDEAVKERPITTLGEAFQGQLAGVRSQATGGGVPGQELTIRIRGMNTINGDSSPLYVIDGVPRNNMSDLNPTDIASIQILKDASASAIYGSRGANGVVLIETKQGVGKPSVSFDAYYGIQTAEKKLDMLSGEEWVAWNMFNRNLDHLRAGGSMKDPMSARQAGNRIPESWAGTSTFTDWQDAVMHTAPIQSYQASASAKGDIGSIYFSAGYLNQEGVVRNSYYERINARLNASMNIGKNLKVGVNLSVADSDKDGADVAGGANGNGKESSLHHAIMMTPLMKLNEGTRDWGFPENIGTTYPNPVEQLKYTTDNTKYMRVATSLWGEYKIIEGLVFKTQYSNNYDGYTYEFYQPGNVTYNNGNITRGSSKATTTRNWVFQNTLSYDKIFKDHHLNVLLGQSTEQQKYYLISASASGWPYESIETLNVATTPTGASTERTTYANASFFGRATYDYKEKYLLTVSARYDGSSRFGSNTKWGWFPSVSAGWKINEEKFMENLDWISLLKLRGAWGMSGNDRIGDYAYMALLGTYNTSWGDKKVSGVAPSNIANEDLQWESTKSLDFGLDLSLIKNRLQLNFDYYVNTTDNLLFSVPIPYTTGFSSYKTNIGSIRNKGWEIDLTSHNIVGKFNWSTSLNLSRNRNEVLDMGDITSFTSSSWDAQFITQVGGPVSQFYCYRTDGVLLPSDFDENGKALVPILSGQEEGNVKYVDQDGDGIISTADYVPYGNNLPDVVFGLTNRFSWNNFDLSILLQGQIGGDIMFMGARQYDGGQAGTNTFKRWLRSYKPDYEALYGAGENPIPVDYLQSHGIDMSWDGETINPKGKNDNNDDRRIYDATYLRIKNITLGYTLPRSLLKNTILNNIRFYVSVDNIKTFDGYPGYTPESNSFGNSTTMMGVDYSTYPLSRRCIFGVNIIF